ncbi:MAG: hypothetical protein CUN56_08975 [Phototrophicales bacterium]|nr:MAG: hypothetical protein CUN56_08975 [Phototrophicales bacterium]RMG74700.1 MAG: hypothetical protein D6711_08170 [Chloroflexota bacterium]
MFRSALTALSNLSVSGVSVNYDIDTVPDIIHRGQLPALLVLPIEPQPAGEGFEVIGFADGIKTMTYTVTHLLLVAPSAAGNGVKSHLPDLIDLIDNYFMALAASVTLGGALMEPARVHVEPGVFTYGETDYIGCAFRHVWMVQI